MKKTLFLAVSTLALFTSLGAKALTWSGGNEVDGGSSVICQNQTCLVELQPNTNLIVNNAGTLEVQCRFTS